MAIVVPTFSRMLTAVSLIHTSGRRIVGTLFCLLPVGTHGMASVRRESPQLRRLARAIVGFARASVLAFMPFGEIQAEENMPPASDKDALISWVLDRFWGHARDSTGAPIQPTSQ